MAGVGWGFESTDPYKDLGIKQATDSLYIVYLSGVAAEVAAVAVVCSRSGGFSKPARVAATSADIQD